MTETDAAADLDVARATPMTPAAAVRIAQEHHRAGRLGDAAALYERILDCDPEQPEALHFLGLLHHQLGHVDQARVCLQRALAARPDYVDARCNLGNLLQESGDFLGAEQCYRAVVAACPDFINAWNNLGVVLRRLGRGDEAEQAYRRALALDPAQALVYSNLGLLALERGALDEAIAACETAIRLAPACAEAHRNLAQALIAARQPEAAVVASRRALELGAEAYEQLGMALRDQGLLDEAIRAFRQAARTDRDNALYNLGILLHQTGHTAEAIDVYRRWLERDPDHPVAKHLLAAWTGVGAETVARASDHYVVTLFDGFAAHFDALLAKLEYRAPELAVEMLAECQGPARRALRILDAGCGTGLGAPLLRPFAATLSGVDLSLAMLERARARRLYDHLARCELTAYLRRHVAAFDTIVSIDTLVYCGDLEPPVAAAAQALVSDGWLILTLEQAPEGIPNGFRLESTGRYAHSGAYLRTVLSRHGFAEPIIRTAVPRLECGEPVAGLIVAARRAAA